MVCNRILLLLSLLSLHSATGFFFYAPHPSRVTYLHSSTVSRPVRSPESPERVAAVRKRFQEASAAAEQGKQSSTNPTFTSDSDSNSWWTDPLPITSRRQITPSDPLRVIITGGGIAGLVTAAACHSLGMKVAIFEQASSYSPYGGPIQIQSNALRALERINPTVHSEVLR